MKWFLISMAALLLLGCGVTTPELANVTIINGLDRHISDIRYRLSDLENPDSDWSENQIEDFLEPGESAILKVSPDVYDLGCFSISDWHVLYDVEITADGYTWLVVSD